MKKRIISLVLIVVAVYICIVNHGFLFEWDDHWVVFNKYTDAGLDWKNLWAVLTEFHQGQYAPFNELSYILIHSVFGYSPMAFHAASLLWHAANTVLLFLFLNRLLKMIPNSPLAGQSQNIAWLCALLWAVHPVNVEPVAWISASKILVYAFYYLAALLLYLYYIERPGMGKYIGLLALFVASFLGKEQAVVLPLAFLLVDYLTKREDKIGYLLLEKAPFLILALFFGIVTIISQGAGGNMPEYSLWQRLLFCGYTLYEYMVKTILPMNLMYLYPFPTTPEGKMPLMMYLYPFMILAAAYLVYLFRKERILVFGTLFFVVHLLVAIHFISISRFAIVADRYNYLAMVGPLLVIVHYLCLWSQKHKMAARVVLGLYFVYLCTYTIIYQQNWDNSEHVKRHYNEIVNSNANASKSLDNKK
ncbi:MAG: hypothetical protein K6F47_07530 [Bacteroidaceae bacterium]|nr:hypothetical protein [Bacteroidaceae bacterium]